MAKSIYCVHLIPLFSILVAQFRVGAAPTLLGGKTLNIGVLMNSDGFVDVKLSSTNQTIQNQVTGYAIDVFTATVSYLEETGLNVSYEFEAFANREGKSAGTYDDLLRQMPRKYNGVVGDITIVANQSMYVDFTLPYTESAVRILTQVGHSRRLDMWIFLRPFSWDLWLPIILFCVFIGFALLFMEHNANKEARLENSLGRKQFTQQSILCRPLAQAVLPERESVAKKCSMFVLLAFPRGSNLTYYFSTAILNVTEGPRMDETEDKCFGINNDDDVQDPYDQISTDTPRLSAQSFAGLFTITGSLIRLALLVSERCIWQRPVMLANTFSKRCMFSLSSKKLNPTEDGSTNGMDASSINEGNKHPEGLQSSSLPV